MQMYETSFATLSDKFFKNSSWPPVEYIEGLVDHDHVFCLLYKVQAATCKSAAEHAGLHSVGQILIPTCQPVLVQVSKMLLVPTQS